MAINSNETNATATSPELEIEQLDLLTYQLLTSHQQDECVATIYLSKSRSPIQDGFLIESIAVAQPGTLSVSDCLEALTRIAQYNHYQVPVLAMTSEFFTRRDEHPCIMTDIGFQYVSEAQSKDDMIYIPLYVCVQPKIQQPVENPPILRYRSTLNQLLNHLRGMGFYLESVNPGNRYFFRAFPSATIGYLPYAVIEFEELPERTEPAWNNAMHRSEPARYQ